MNDNTKETLATLERLVERGALSPHAAIQAAYKLGDYDGKIAMAQIGQKKVGELLEQAA